jgi:hypothetical protein
MQSKYFLTFPRLRLVELLDIVVDFNVLLLVCPNVLQVVPYVLLQVAEATLSFLCAGLVIGGEIRPAASQSPPLVLELH